MSNGKVHAKFTKDIILPGVIIITTGAYFIAGTPAIPFSIVFSSLGLITGFVLTPDLDLIEGSYGFHIVNKIIGRFFGKLWQIYWKPYAKLIPHRNILSHSLLLSTAIRLIYLCIPLFIGVQIVHGWTELLHFIYNYWDWFLYFYLGLCFSDAGHLLLDFILPFRHLYEKLVPKSYLINNKNE